jgi:virginiamycin B lyase
MNSGKIVIYCIVAIMIATITAITHNAMIRSVSNNSNKQTTLPTTASIAASSNSSSLIEQFKNQFCGLNSIPNSNDYVTEYKLPHTCEMPLGLAVDSQAGKVWYISTKQGVLGSYNLVTKKFDKEITIPNWKVRQNPVEFSDVWSVKVSSKGDSVWFTDDKQNAIWKYNKALKQFEIYKVPETPLTFGTISPVSLDFDSKGNVYFVGIHSSMLWFGNITQMKNGTSNGVTKIPMPLDVFKGVDSKEISTGSIAIDNKRDMMWISMSAFSSQGEILRYHIASRTFDTFVLPEQLSLPVGLAVDNNGNLWTTDHGTSVFYMLDAKNHNVTMFTTSKISQRINGLNESNNLPEGSGSTLPYWIEKGPDDGYIWFNEHQGNKIARFDPSNNTLYEYWIPTQDKLWGDCPPTSRTCGIANVLQFSRGENSQTWFTEWSENKIGSIMTPTTTSMTITNNTGNNNQYNNNNYSHQVPFSVSASPEKLTLKTGQSFDIRVDISRSRTLSSSSSFIPLNTNVINMTASSTFTPDGGLGNSTGIFSQQSFSLAPMHSKEVSFIFTPASDLGAGEYTLMLGAQNDEVTVLKAVKVHILD